MQNALTILSFIIGIIGVLLAAWTARGKKVTIIATNFQSLITIFDDVKNSVGLLYKKRTIDELNRIELLFQNIGSKEIDGQDIVSEEPIRFRVPEHSNILDFNITSTDDSNIKPVIERIDESTIQLKFTLIRRNHSIRLILFTNIKNQDDLFIDGRIKDMPYISKIRRMGTNGIVDLLANYKGKIQIAFIYLVFIIAAAFYIVPLFSYDSYFPNPKDHVLISEKFLNGNFAVDQDDVKEVYSDSSDRFVAFDYIDTTELAPNSYFENLRADGRINLGYKKLRPAIIDTTYSIGIRNGSIDTIFYSLQNDFYEKPLFSDFVFRYYLHNRKKALLYSLLLLLLIFYIFYKALKIKRLYMLLNSYEKDSLFKIYRSVKHYLLKFRLTLLNFKNG